MEEFLGFVIAILLGALIGLQREYVQQHSNKFKFAGIRTFILITFLGAIIGFLSLEFESSVLVVAGFLVVSLLALISYVVTYLKYKDTTATTEVSSILAFVVGVMTTTGYLKLAVIFGILVAGFLAFKKKIHKAVENLKKKELLAIVKFALISAVILPLLPNKDYSPADLSFLKEFLMSLSVSESLLQQLTVFNPFKIWLMVIFISGISFVGYFFVKFFGARKGYGLTGFFGGLVSSTAVTLSMSEESKKSKKLAFPLIIAVVIASSTTFLRILFEVSVLNPSLVVYLLVPFVLMAFLGYGISYYLFKTQKKKKKIKEIEFEQPFAIMPALKFGLFFAFIIFISKLAQIFIGEKGLYLTSIFSGLADVDAITLTMSSLSSSGEIASHVAVISIFLAAISNTIVKAGICLIFGDKKFAKYVALIFGIIIALGVLSILFL